MEGNGWEKIRLLGGKDRLEWLEGNTSTMRYSRVGREGTGENKVNGGEDGRESMGGNKVIGR